MNKLSRSIWGPVMVICLTVVISSAVTAGATRLITGKQIKDNSITSRDIANGTIRGADLTSDLVVHAPSGPSGVVAASGGARAYAQVDYSGPSLIAARTKGFLSVSRPQTGVYCVKVDSSTGVDPRTTAAVATIEYGNTDPNTDQVEVRGVNTVDCAADEFDVHTFDAGNQPVNTASFMLISP